MVKESMMAKSLDSEKKTTTFGKFDYREIAKQYSFKKLDAPKAKKTVSTEPIPIAEDLDYLNEIYAIPSIDLETPQPANEVTKEPVETEGLRNYREVAKQLDFKK